jgi:hypothetical protein
MMIKAIGLKCIEMILSSHSFSQGLDVHNAEDNIIKKSSANASPNLSLVHPSLLTPRKPPSSTSSMRKDSFKLYKNLQFDHLHSSDSLSDMVSIRLEMILSILS